MIARRVYLGLRRKDAETLAHGVETGIVSQLPDGGFTEVVRPVTDEERAVLAAGRPPRALPEADASGVPAPGGTGLTVRLRTGLNAAFTATAAVTGRRQPGIPADDECHQAGRHGELPAGEPRQARLPRTAGR